MNERVDYSPQVREVINELMRMKDAINGRMAELQFALNKATGNWAKADELLHRTCKIESKIYREREYVPESYYEYEMECGGQFRWYDVEPPNYCPDCGAKVVSE